MERPQHNSYQGFPGFTLIELMLSMGAFALLLAATLALMTWGWKDIKRANSSKVYEPLTNLVRETCPLQKSAIFGPQKCLYDFGYHTFEIYSR